MPTPSSVPPAPRRVRAADVLLTALAPVVWGSTYIVTTELLPEGRPLTAAALRCLPAGLLMMLYFRSLPARGQWLRVAVLALLNIGAFQALLFVAAYRLPGGLAAVLGACQPLVVLALAWGVERQRPRAAVALAAAAGVAGMALLLLSPGARWDALGVAAALAGAVSMAAGIYLTRLWKPASPSVVVFTGWQLLIGGLALAPLAWLTEPPLPALAPPQVLGYAYLCLVGALVAYSLWFRGVQALPTVAVSSLGLLSPLTAVVLGWVLLGQGLGPLAFLGMALVLGSIAVVQWGSGTPAARPGKPA